MIIVEWTKPGIWIKGLDRDDAFRIEGQIRSLEDMVAEANVVLNLFEQTQLSEITSETVRAEYEARAKINREVKAELSLDSIATRQEATQGATTEYEKRQAIVDYQVRHRLWRSGFLPRVFLHKKPFIFAKAFIHALDLFGKFLGDIAEDQAAPNDIQDIRDRYFEALPDLQEVRNSIQHAEDRSKGMVRGRKIDLKKIDKSKFPVGAGLINSGLYGNKYGTTMKDGHYGAVDITADTIMIMRCALLEVYCTFEWKGGEQLFPT